MYQRLSTFLRAPARTASQEGSGNGRCLGNDLGARWPGHLAVRTGDVARPPAHRLASRRHSRHLPHTL